jgi:hypothetical protein
VGLNSLKSLNLTNVYPNNNKKNKNKNNKVKSKPLEFYELAGKKTIHFHYIFLNLKIIRQSSICAKVVYRFQEKNPTGACNAVSCAIKKLGILCVPLGFFSPEVELTMPLL